ncbi:MAG TPA: YlxR family protein [Candidatus Dormibacteraeota bacterium]|nr:YlxR family protein [Candidatus Dormibacteraeota bacterium]
MPNRRRDPIRTCVACRQEAGKRSLVRVVRGAGGVASIDAAGRAPGRAAYLHRDPECIEIARKKKALDRALKATVGPDVWAELGS